MDFNKTKKVLQDFGKNVVIAARKNLKKKRIRRNGKSYPLVATGQLDKSVDDNLKVSPNSLQLQFMYLDYGAYLDAGVDGTKKKYGERKYGLKKFSYNSQGNSLKGMPPTSSILKWVNKKRLRLRNKDTGKFMKGGQKSLAFLIARSIFWFGKKPSYWFSDAFESAYKKLPQEFIDAYALDVESFLDQTTQIK